jgi:hypothetical protein
MTSIKLGFVTYVSVWLSHFVRFTRFSNLLMVSFGIHYAPVRFAVSHPSAHTYYDIHYESRALRVSISCFKSASGIIHFVNESRAS